MDHARGRLEATDQEIAVFAVDCPDCGLPSSRLPPVRPSLLGALPLRRCLRCGCRCTCEPEPRRVLNCTACGLPYFDEPGTAGRCPACCTGEFEIELPDPTLTAASEAEVRAALCDAWAFVGSEPISRYLARVLRGLARHIEGAPIDGRVVILEDRSCLTLAFPAGTVMLSLGMLGLLEDEAELAFVLGHELAHVACGDTAAALVRFGLRDLAERKDDPAEGSWTQVAMDLIHMGHGDRSELAADATALAAMQEVGYDPAAAARLLGRVRDRTGAGEPGLAVLSVAHPPATDRIDQVERIRSAALRLHAYERVDREVFRRLAGHTVLASGLTPVRPFADRKPGPRVVLRLPTSGWLWAAVGILLLALLALLLTLD